MSAAARLGETTGRDNWARQLGETTGQDGRILRWFIAVACRSTVGGQGLFALPRIPDRASKDPLVARPIDRKLFHINTCARRSSLPGAGGSRPGAVLRKTQKNQAKRDGLKRRRHGVVLPKRLFFQDEKRIAPTFSLGRTGRRAFAPTGLARVAVSQVCEVVYADALNPVGRGK